MKVELCQSDFYECYINVISLYKSVSIYDDKAGHHCHRIVSDAISV